MMQTMIDCGLDVECQHHEVGTAGQSEIDLRFSELVKMADNMLLYKYIIKNVAKKHGKYGLQIGSVVGRSQQGKTLKYEVN